MNLTNKNRIAPPQLQTIARTISFLVLFTLSPTLAKASDGDLRRFTFEVNPGVAWMQNISYRDASGSGSFSVDPGPSLELALGYKLNESFLIELQSGLRYFPSSSQLLNQFDEYVREDFTQVPVMARIIYKFPLHSRFRPFLGAGVGGIYTYVEDDIDVFYARSVGSDFTFGYQACAGVRYQINRLIALGLEYDFLGTTEHNFGSLHIGQTQTHNVAVSLSLQF